MGGLHLFFDARPNSGAGAALRQKMLGNAREYWVFIKHSHLDPEFYPQKAIAIRGFLTLATYRSHLRFKSVDAVRTEGAAFHADVVGLATALRFEAALPHAGIGATFPDDLFFGRIKLPFSAAR